MLKLLLSVVLSVTTTVAMAWQPTKLVTMVIPAPPGGSVDNVARVVVKKMNQLGVKTIAVNQVGGSGSIGTNAVKKAPADGHVLLFNPTSFVFGKINELPGYDFDLLEDFTHISIIATGDVYIYASPKNTESLEEVFSNIRTGKKEYTWGTGSPMGIFVLNDISSQLNKKMVIVRYNNLNALNDLVSGDINFLVDTANHPARNLIPDGKVRFLASLEKSPANVTTVDQFLPGTTLNTWMGISVPGRTDSEIVNFYKTIFTKITNDSEVKEQFHQLNVRAQSTLDMTTVIKQYYKKYANFK
jgi:tripartite-type tricarboxylate transporter receptor subunit TctC